MYHLKELLFEYELYMGYDEGEIYLSMNSYGEGFLSIEGGVLFTFHNLLELEDFLSFDNGY